MSKADYEFATPPQIRYIAILSMQLGMDEPTVTTKAEAGRMIRELQAEKKHTESVKRNALVNACYNALAETGIAVYYDIITNMVKRKHPGLGATDKKVLAVLNVRKDLFRKIDTGVYFLAGKEEGKVYPRI